MEVWALEAYSASHILQEIYEAIVKNAPIRKPNIPESFNVLIKELQAIGLDVKLLDAEELMHEEDLAEERYNDIVKLEKKLESEVPETKEKKKAAPKKAAAKKEKVEKEEKVEDKAEEKEEAKVEEAPKEEKSEK